MNTLMLALLFGSIGVGYFVYGKKQRRPIPLVVGMALNIFPYFLTNTYVMAIVGTVLTVLPWFLRDL